MYADEASMSSSPQLLFCSRDLARVQMRVSHFCSRITVQQLIQTPVQVALT